MYWKLDTFENSLRMRKRLKQNYKGVDHHTPIIFREQSQRGSFDGVIPVTSSMAKLITADSSADGAGEVTPTSEEAVSLLRKEDLNSKNEIGPSGVARVQSSPTVAAATSSSSSATPAPTPAAPSVAEPKEVLILEMPGVMIQPLKVRGGMFQVSIPTLTLALCIIMAR